MISLQGTGQEWQLQQLGAEWYIDYTPDPSNIPAGRKKMLYVPVAVRYDGELAEYAAQAPGSVWYLGGEPNKGRITPSEYVEWFDRTVDEIKGADPTARIAGPSILNWEFTCHGCPGFQSGAKWMREFINEYRDSHDGEAPPVDIWTMDVYPLNWRELPMTDWRLMTEQMEGFRRFLENEVPEHSDTPIWITEIASHWAFQRLAFTEDGKPTIPDHMDWEEDYQWEAMERYMTNLLDWLQANGPSLHIDRWFFFVAYIDIERQSQRDGYAGIRFFQSPGSGAPLNRLGHLYREYITGER